MGLTGKTIEIATTDVNFDNVPTPVFQESQFEAALWNKGYEVVIERAVQCACKSEAVNQQSNCANCGGFGWIYINPIRTKSIITGMNQNIAFKEWSRQDTGMVNVTVRNDEQLGEFDRITLLDAVSQYSEVIHGKVQDSVVFAQTVYGITSISFIALYDTPQSPLIKLVEGNDYTFEKYSNLIRFNDVWSARFNTNPEEVNVSIRYAHNPQYGVIETRRDVMNSYIKVGSRKDAINLPVSAVGQRFHYLIDPKGLNGSSLLDNSTNGSNCLKDYQNGIC